MIPQLLNERSETILKVLKDAKDKLSRPIKNVGDYCVFYTFLKKLQEEWNDLFSENINIQLIKELSKK